MEMGLLGLYLTEEAMCQRGLALLALDVTLVTWGPLVIPSRSVALTETPSGGHLFVANTSPASIHASF